MERVESLQVRSLSLLSGVLLLVVLVLVNVALARTHTRLDLTEEGRYTLAVGLYDPITGQRLPVSAGPASYAIELGPVEVR